MKLLKLTLLATLLVVVAGSPVLSRNRTPEPLPTPPVITAEKARPRAPIREHVSFVYERIIWTYDSDQNSTFQFLIAVPNSRQFLADPVKALKQQRIAVPTSAEPHWRALARALGRLSNRQLPPSSRSSLAPKNIASLKNEIGRIHMPWGWIPIVGDWNGDGTVSIGNFLSNPVDTLHTRGVKVPAADEATWRQLTEALKALRRSYAKPGASLNQQDSSTSTGGFFLRNSNSLGPASNDLNPGQSEGGNNDYIHQRPGSSKEEIKFNEFTIKKTSDRTTKTARAARPDLQIKQFVFSPTNDKAMRVHVVNTGGAPSGLCLLRVTVRKINGVSVGRVTEVKLLPLGPGKDKWLIVDAKSILPNNVSLESTTFKINADATSIVAESVETNNEVWHNL